MKTTTKGVQILLIFGCNTVENNLHVENTIIAKYELLDEELSPKRMNCEEKTLDFLRMGKFDCSFKLENREFDIEKKFVLDELGNGNEYWNYLSEGPVIYTLTELKADKNLFESLSIEKINVSIAKNGLQINDSGETLNIERIYKAEKLIFVVRNKETLKNNKRIIYQYK